MMPINYKKTVANGYDKIGQAYGEQAARGRTEQRNRYERELLDRLPQGASVLDLGCGSGIPTTRRFARKFSVTGADISPKQIERAKVNVPNGEFICSDMASLDFPPESFDGISAFYSIVHLPRDEQGPLLKSIVSWLKPLGVFVGCLGSSEAEIDFDKSWMGAPMYWSSYDLETNRQLVFEAGLEPLVAKADSTSNRDDSETFLWIVARKPAA